jgi:hypothetical protein
MKRVRVLVVLLAAFGASLPLLSMVPSQSQAECLPGACFSNDDCDSGSCTYNPPFITCGTCEN